jgi:hypothetical protein
MRTAGAPELLCSPSPIAEGCPLLLCKTGTVVGRFGTWVMRRYASRDWRRNRIGDLLPGHESRVGVTAADDGLFVDASPIATSRCFAAGTPEAAR